MRIAIDAMGGDNAPDAIIEGAIEAIKSKSLDSDDVVILVGQQDVIEAKLTSRQLRKYSSILKIEHAPEVIDMEDKPIEALRQKRKSSISVMTKLASRGHADAVISAGNTGAFVAACQMRMRNLEGINRPGITVIFPTFEGPVTMCDVGANIACKAINFYQYAVMASIYSKYMLGTKEPRIGLMSIGEEDSKGNETVKKARELIKADPMINLIGNIEGRDIFRGTCDVVICEGFVGNVILKLTEGLVDGLFKAIKHELISKSKRLALKFKPIMMGMYQKYDYHEYGGAPLLGINGTALICHGSSKARTVKNAIMAVKKFHKVEINKHIVEHLSQANTRTNDE